MTFKLNSRGDDVNSFVNNLKIECLELVERTKIESKNNCKLNAVLVDEFHL